MAIEPIWFGGPQLPDGPREEADDRRAPPEEERPDPEDQRRAESLAERGFWCGVAALFGGFVLGWVIARVADKAGWGWLGPALQAVMLLAQVACALTAVTLARRARRWLGPFYSKSGIRHQVRAAMAFGVGALLIGAVGQTWLTWGAFQELHLTSLLNMRNRSDAEVAELLRHSDERVHRAALSAIAKRKAGAYAADVASLLGDAGTHSRVPVIRVLGSMGASGAAAVPALVAMLDDERTSNDEKLEVVLALKAIDPQGPVVLTALAGLLSRDVVREEVTGAFIAAGATAIPVLEAAAREGYRDDRDRACELIGAIIRQHADARGAGIAAIATLQRHELAAIRGSATRALPPALGVDSRALPQLRLALRDQDPRVRWLAGVAAFQSGYGALPECSGAIWSARTDMLLAIRSEWNDLMPDAARLINTSARWVPGGSHGEWKHTLVQLVSNPAWEVRAAAVNALSELGDPPLDAAAHLARLVGDPAPYPPEASRPAKRAAVALLRRLGPGARDAVTAIRRWGTQEPGNAEEAEAAIAEILGR